MFERWGRFVFRRRWIVLAGSVVALGISIGLTLQGGTLSSGNSAGSGIEAARANDLVVKQLTPAKQKSTGATFLLILSSGSLQVTDPAFRQAVDDALAPLKSDARVTDLTTPYTVPPTVAPGWISKDGHRALVQVTMRDRGLVAQREYPSLRGEVRSATLSVKGTGTVALNRSFNTTLENDLQRAEVVSLPVTLVLLLLIFGSLLAAGLPLGVGILAIVGGIGGTLFMARFTDVSQYALNIVTLIGLAVAIDYSLFIVNRFRDELAAGRTREDAVAATMATAGRAVTFSGLTVAIGLGSMLFFQGTFLASMGAAGTVVVAIAVLYGLTFLPALLSVMGGAVNRLHLPLFRPHRTDAEGFWRAAAEWVMKRPVVVLVPTLAFLLLAGIPFLSIRLAGGSVDELPPGEESRQGYDILVADFPGQDQTVVEVVANYPGGHPLTSDRVGALYDFDRRLAAMPNVLRVDGIFSDASMTRADYQRLYSGAGGPLPAPMLAATQRFTGSQVVVFNVVTNQPSTSDGARSLVTAVRGQSIGGDGQVLVTGETAYDMDVIGYILHQVPIALAFVVLVTYLVLFMLTGSVVLPLKAVVVNMLSISASFGALVWIFQQGHLAGLLDFTPQSIDPTVPVILFAIVFGMSMDYEVFLIARMQEEYRRTGDNRRAVAVGLQRSGRLITGAAAIMVAVFMAFGLAEVVIIKSIGLGLAIAVAIDATIVRVLLVPAVMRLLGPWNWWAPRPVAWLHQRVGAAEPALRPLPEAVR